MKRFQTVIVLLALLFLLTGTVVGQTITLPVLVFQGNENEIPYTVSKTVTVSDNTNIDELWMKVHNLSYEGKMSVRVNGGTWFTPTNVNTEVSLPEYHYGGIGGAWSTIRISVPVSGVVNGSNTIDWRFNGTDGLSAGFRVLDFHFLRSDSSTVTVVESLVLDDPGIWTGYSSDPDSLADGADAWYNASLVHVTKGAMDAKCTDCHSENAEDLVYFNYENDAIVQRSEFHGLSNARSRNIASWIRSLSGPNPGRPWNPPFQPGPGLDSGDPEDWSAGAGLEYVLDSDIEMFDLMFPSGVTPASVHPDSNLNVRELPVSAQFPDWNNWLPRDHPMDLWSDFVSTSEAWTIYTVDFPALIAQGPSYYFNKNRLTREFEGLANAVGDWREETPSPFGSTIELAEANLSLMLWQIVKVWEIMRQNDLEDNATDIYPVYGEALSWFGQARNIFDVAPHISGVGTQGNSYLTNGSPDEPKSKYYSHLWYQLQMTVNSGNRDPLVHRPVDWKYQFGHTEDVSKGGDSGYGVPSAMRIVETYIKQLQMLNNGLLGERGWYMRHVLPYWFIRSLWGQDLTYGPQWTETTAQQREDIGRELLRAFVRINLEFPVSVWDRGEDHHELEPVTYTPYVDSSFGGEIRFDYASTLYTILHMAPSRGIPATLSDSLAEWAEEAWPLGDWEQFMITVTYGDVTENGDVSALDASQLLQHISGLITLEGTALINADVSGNGSVSTLDASLILQYVSGLITCFPAESGCG